MCMYDVIHIYPVDVIAMATYKQHRRHTDCSATTHVSPRELAIWGLF